MQRSLFGIGTPEVASCQHSLFIRLSLSVTILEMSREGQSRVDEVTALQLLLSHHCSTFVLVFRFGCAWLNLWLQVFEVYTWFAQSANPAPYPLFQRRFVFIATVPER